MEYHENFIKKEYTNIIKGIALIMMFSHHFFTFPDWYITGYSFKGMVSFSAFFNSPLKLCVPLFAFLTGYFYAYNEKKNYKYSFRKTTDLWVHYIICFAFLLIIALVSKSYTPSVKNVLLELFCIENNIMCFCWYVSFYFLSMMLLPLFSKIADKHILWGIITGFIGPWFLSFIYERFHVFLPYSTIEDMIKNFTFFSVTSSGYIFAKYNVFSRVFDKLFKNSLSRIVQIIISVGILAFSFMGRYFSPTVSFDNVVIRLDVIYAPLFIYGVVNLIELFPYKKLLKPIGFLGKYSLSLWFIHCIFYNCCNTFMQHLLYRPQFPPLVLIWGILLCIIPSILFTKIGDKICKLKNTFFL